MTSWPSWLGGLAGELDDPLGAGREGKGQLAEGHGWGEVEGRDELLDLLPDALQVDG